LALLASAQLMLVLDVTVVNVALPDIGAALHLQQGVVPGHGATRQREHRPRLHDRRDHRCGLRGDRSRRGSRRPPQAKTVVYAEGRRVQVRLDPATLRPAPITPELRTACRSLVAEEAASTHNAA
jgi:hypothetical protein